MLCSPADAVIRPAAPSDAGPRPTQPTVGAEVLVEPAVAVGGRDALGLPPRQQRLDDRVRRRAASRAARPGCRARRCRPAPSSVFTWAGLRRSNGGAVGGAWREHLGLAGPGQLLGVGGRRGATPDEAGDERLGDGPVHRAGRRPSARRTAARPPTRTGPSPRPGPTVVERLRTGERRSTIDAASWAHRARRSGDADQSARRPTRAEVAVGADRIGLDRRRRRAWRLAWLNRSIGARRPGSSTTAGRAPTPTPAAGSADHPPTSNRWTAAMSHDVATRTPTRTSVSAVSPDHITHRGRSSWSTRSTTAAAAEVGQCRRPGAPRSPARPPPAPARPTHHQPTHRQPRAPGRSPRHEVASGRPPRPRSVCSTPSAPGVSHGRTLPLRRAPRWRMPRRLRSSPCPPPAGTPTLMSPGQLRWWDGAAWSAHTMPAPFAPRHRDRWATDRPVGPPSTSRRTPLVVGGLVRLRAPAGGRRRRGRAGQPVERLPAANQGSARPTAPTSAPAARPTAPPSAPGPRRPTSPCSGRRAAPPTPTPCCASRRSREDGDHPGRRRHRQRQRPHRRGAHPRPDRRAPRREPRTATTPTGWPSS